MPKIIVTSRYMRNTPKRNAANLVKYMGTREGVEKVARGIDHAPATVRQQRLIKDILKYDSDAARYPEYGEYLKEPCKSNATDFIDAFIERNADRVGEMKKLVSYIAQRPGVEKLGAHGLFSQTDDKIDLNEVAEEVGQHGGVIWTHVVSLRREDAERLGYNNAKAWRDLVRRNITAIAQAQKIDISNLQWYAAFHDTAHHPHMHLLIYAKDAKQGWLTKKGIDELRSVLGNDIFRNEQYKLFTMETELRDGLKDKVQKLLDRMDSGYAASPEMQELFQKLISQLDGYTGRKQFGYLPPEMKFTVNQIVAELAKDKGVAEIYGEWNRINREKLSLYYDRKKPDIPLEENREFRSLKNEVLRAAARLNGLSQAQAMTPSGINFAVGGLIKQLCRLISASYGKKLSRLQGQVDGKLRSKIEQKKAAQGLKTDHSIPQSGDEKEEEETEGWGLFL